MIKRSSHVYSAIDGWTLIVSEIKYTHRFRSTCACVCTRLFGSKSVDVIAQSVSNDCNAAVSFVLNAHLRTSSSSHLFLFCFYVLIIAALCCCCCCFMFRIKSPSPIRKGANLCGFDCIGVFGSKCVSKFACEWFRSASISRSVCCRWKRKGKHEIAEDTWQHI